MYWLRPFLQTATPAAAATCGFFNSQNQNGPCESRLVFFVALPKLTSRPEELPTSCCGILEVYETIALRQAYGTVVLVTIEA